MAPARVRPLHTGHAVEDDTPSGRSQLNLDPHPEGLAMADEHEPGVRGARALADILREWSGRHGLICHLGIDGDSITGPAEGACGDLLFGRMDATAGSAQGSARRD